MEIYLLVTVILGLIVLILATVNRNRLEDAVPHGRMLDRRMFWWLISVGVCFVLFGVLTSWFVIYNVESSQHAFCQLLTTLNNPPKGIKAPPPGSYGSKIAQDLTMLARNFGC